jgi:hypothetical protein
MRKSIILASALLSISVALPAVAQDHQWVRVTTDNDDNVYLLDKKVAGRGRFRRYWVAMYPKPENGDKQWQKWLYSIDCQSKPKVRRLRMEVYYDTDGREDSSNNYGGNGDLEKVTSQMPIGLRVANAACSIK